MFEIENLKLLKTKYVLPPLSGPLLSLIPYFLKYSPPFLPIIITPLVSMFYIIVAFNNRFKISQQLIKRARNALILLVCVIIAYFLFIDMTTITDPRGEKRFQLGFNGFDFSLTKEGREWKKDNPTKSMEDWMKSFGAFKKGGPQLIWKPATIYLAGTILSIAYILAFVFLTYVLGIMVILKSVKE